MTDRDPERERQRERGPGSEKIGKDKEINKAGLVPERNRDRDRERSRQGREERERRHREEKRGSDRVRAGIAQRGREVTRHH